jgi:hypothetical protein
MGPYAFSQTQIVYHSFNSGSSRSEGNSSVLTSVLGQPIFGTSSANGISVYSGYSLFGKSMVLGVTQRSEQVPAEFVMYQNYPNPFNPSTTIGFTLQQSGLTTLKIYDAIGREIATLINENLEAGVYYQKTFDASKLSSGMYFARLTSSGNSKMKKLVLMK